MPHYENVPFEVPDNWVWMTLGEVGTWQSGGTPSRSNKTYYGGNIPWLKTGDLNDGLISDIPESITEEAVANSSAKINPAGSVLIAMYGATIGKLGILTFPATTNQACCACIEFNAITQLYLFYFFIVAKKWVYRKRWRRSATQYIKRNNRKHLYSFTTPFRATAHCNGNRKMVCLD